MSQNPLGFTVSHPGVRRLELNGLSVEVNSPPATQSRRQGGVEQVAGLAAGRVVEPYPVDAYPGCPNTWVRSDPSAKIAAYFMKAEADHMVWFNLNANGADSHDVAAFFSAQGICGMTGRTVDRVQLQQFRECPIHRTPFGAKHFCERCGHIWPPQNYLATTATGYGAFWRDGFVGEDGTTREFVFTTNESEGVAAALIGEARSSAFGIALFRSREPKPYKPPPVHRGGNSPFESFDGGLECSRGATLGGGYDRMEVKAGALVRQEVEPDPKPIDYWRDQPDAQFIIYYAGPRQFADILATGPVRHGSFLGRAGVPTGHNG